jgi:hypothetical protein
MRLYMREKEEERAANVYAEIFKVFKNYMRVYLSYQSQYMIAYVKFHERIISQVRQKNRGKPLTLTIEKILQKEAEYDEILKELKKCDPSAYLKFRRKKDHMSLTTEELNQINPALKVFFEDQDDDMPEWRADIRQNIIDIIDWSEGPNCLQALVPVFRKNGKSLNDIIQVFDTQQQEISSSLNDRQILMDKFKHFQDSNRA